MDVVNRDWDVLIVGGASGTGKSSLSRRLSSAFGVGITEFDDVVEAIKAMTSPEQEPTLHHWDLLPATARPTARQIAELTEAVCSRLHPAAEAVVANHLDTDVPIVIEGDYLLPQLAAQTQFQRRPAAGRVRAVFLYESDQEQIAANLRRREPGGGDMLVRSRVSWLISETRRLQCADLGLPAVPARPWHTLLDRVTEVI